MSTASLTITSTPPLMPMGVTAIHTAPPAGNHIQKGSRHALQINFPKHDHLHSLTSSPVSSATPTLKPNGEGTIDTARRTPRRRIDPALPQSKTYCQSITETIDDCFWDCIETMEKDSRCCICTNTCESFTEEELKERTASNGEIKIYFCTTGNCYCKSTAAVGRLGECLSGLGTKIAACFISCGIGCICCIPSYPITSVVNCCVTFPPENCCCQCIYGIEAIAKECFSIAKISSGLIVKDSCGCSFVSYCCKSDSHKKRNCCQKCTRAYEESLGKMIKKFKSPRELYSVGNLPLNKKMHQYASDCCITTTLRWFAGYRHWKKKLDSPHPTNQSIEIKKDVAMEVAGTKPKPEINHLVISVAAPVSPEATRD